MKIILVFKTHFDIGFTDLAEHVIRQYAEEMLPRVIETCEATRDMGKLRYVWTMPGWPLYVMRENASAEDRKALDRLIGDGQIVWHALPFTSHFDFGDLTDAIEGLQYARALSGIYHKPLPVSAKMTDVPGHGKALPTILAGAGIRFLHLGANAFASPPAVPLLFFWEGVDGSRVLTMYSKGGYGSSLLPPEGWGYPVWMALMHTQDNCGPQSAEILRKIEREIREKMPDAEIECGTMDDFFRELSQYDLNALPIINKDLADTWIHGVGSYPAEVSQVRRARQLLLAAGVRASQNKTGSVEAAALMRKAQEALILFDEHTWGLDVKTWLPQPRYYEKKELQAALKTQAYRKMERSWQEQRERSRTAAVCAEKALDLAMDPMERGETASGLVSEAFGCEPLLRKDLSTIENKRYRLRFDRERGIITELFDKNSDCILLRERDGYGVFSYQYDIYGSEDLTEYLRHYAYRFSDWGIRDNGKDDYPECAHRTFCPVFEKLKVEGYRISLFYRGTGVEEYGDGRRIIVSVSLPPEGEELFVQVQMEGKEETAYTESGSLFMPLAFELPRYRINKNGSMIDPARDIAEGANHALYCIEAFAAAEDGKNGVCIISHDTPLLAIGETGIYTYRKRYEMHQPILVWNLFNNMWGTNFPQWISGNFNWEFTLFGYREGNCADLYQRALSLYTGAGAIHGEAEASPFQLPEGVLLLSLRPREGGGWILRLRDTALKGRKTVLRAPGYWIQKTDLFGRREGERRKGEISFYMRAYGILAFEIWKTG